MGWLNFFNSTGGCGGGQNVHYVPQDFGRLGDVLLWVRNRRIGSKPNFVRKVEFRERKGAQKEGFRAFWGQKRVVNGVFELFWGDFEGKKVLYRCSKI